MAERMRLQLQRPGPPALVAALRSVVYGGSAVRRPLGDCRSHCRAAGLLDCTLCGLRAAAAAPGRQQPARGAGAVFTNYLLPAAASEK
jgi:hypothetical protein